ncbi:alkaline phosphatase family protein [Alginatibacterium sediminis]|uniref:Alkaline phosphatase family protein n=2 Tax=Alginatibacterium sediminis TaxID=2164068 RepID=A0A420EIH9_9ALTE|nr:alkaline phosphatase family protein [Alginatibacterium sediminis]
MIVLSSISLSNFAAADSDTQIAPKLVLQITVDALRGDLPYRYQEQFGDKGFKYFMREGLVFKNAHYQHANTETIVGHASLATGATPSIHGMVGNIWFDRTQDRVVYNIEDENYSLLGEGGDVDKSTEIDATQKAANSDGRSPLPFLVSTFSDELAISSFGQSKIFGVSVKDRGAVSLAGQYGKAFWFSKSKSQFVTSDYYYDTYPQWVSEFNAQGHPNRYSDTSWELSVDSNDYRVPADQDVSYKTDLAGFGQQFPHPYGPASDKYFTTKLTLSPAGDALTLDFAKALLDAENLGNNQQTDYLSVSFSSNDYVIHIFGPSSREAEDNLIQLDQRIAELLQYVDDKVGLQNTLVVLSADHGAPEVPGYLSSLGGKKSRYFDINSLTSESVDARLKSSFGVGVELIDLYTHPYIYLNQEVLATNKLDSNQVAQTLTQILQQLDGIQYAVSKSDLQRTSLASSPIMERISNNFHPDRSGEIYLVFEPNVYINDFDGLEVASVHGSPWNYDTHVPIMFLAPGLDSSVIQRPVTPYDIAPTLSHYLNINSPSGSTGQPLLELFDSH